MQAALGGPEGPFDLQQLVGEESRSAGSRLSAIAVTRCSELVEQGGDG